MNGLRSAARLALGVAAVALGAQQPVSAADPAADELRSMLEQQRQQMEQQSRELERMREQLDWLDRERGESAPAASAEPAEQPINGLPPPPEPLERAEEEPSWFAVDRPDFNIGRPQKGGPPEAYVAPAQAVTAGDFPGSIRIPGTDASFAVGGYVKLDVIHDFDDIGSEDLFVTSTIPTDGNRDGRTRLHARQSRLNFDLRAPSPIGDFRTFVEGDFFGVGGTQVVSNSHSFRLRHAFAELGNLTAGQTWSTYMDVAALPETIDFEGPNAESFIRQALLRWTQPLGGGLSLAVAVENPEGDIFDDGDLQLDRVPDGVLRARWDQPWGHLQAGFVGREIRLVDADGSSESDFGYGVNVSGRFNVGHFLQVPGIIHEKDNFVFQAQYGDGIGRYIIDIAGLGADAAFNPATGELETLQAWGAYGGYQHWWTDALRSTAVFGYVSLDAEGFQPPGTFDNSQYVAANLIWTPTRGSTWAWNTCSAGARTRTAPAGRPTGCSSVSCSASDPRVPGRSAIRPPAARPGHSSSTRPSTSARYVAIASAGTAKPRRGGT